MIIQNPLILFYDPSFQLSFLATLGLILLSSPIEKKLFFITEKLGMRGLVASTLATQIFISPYILYMMGQLSIIGVIVNILVLPIIPLTMLFVFLTGALGFISHFISQIAGWVSHILLSYELFIVRFFAQLPFASIELPSQKRTPKNKMKNRVSIIKVFQNFLLNWKELKYSLITFISFIYFIYS